MDADADVYVAAARGEVSVVAAYVVRGVVVRQWCKQDEVALPEEGLLSLTWSKTRASQVTTMSNSSFSS